MVCELTPEEAAVELSAWGSVGGEDNESEGSARLDVDARLSVTSDVDDCV